MKIQAILNFIDNGHMALPEFQRGYVWNRNQVRGFFESLYRRHPVGGLLVWATKSETAEHRGDNQLAPGVVKLLLDGQQRMTTLYGVIRGKPPEFFEGEKKAITGLYFHMETESFAFYQPSKMKDDPLWVNVTKLMQEGYDGLGDFVGDLSNNLDTVGNANKYIGRLTKLLGITDTDLHIDEVTGDDKTVDVVVDIFNRVNSGGTKLSKGDLALAKICAEWPDAREKMRAKITELNEAGYRFTLDWLLRSVNTVLTGEAKFHFLHDRTADEVQNSLVRASKFIDECLNMISRRLGLDHGQVLFAGSSIPVMVRYLDQRNGSLNEGERDKLLFWYVQSGMWGRYSGSVESVIDADIEALSSDDGGIDRLLEKLRLSRGSLKIESEHFTAWGKGARLYPVLYLLTRTGRAQNFCDGLPVAANMLGKMNQLEIHHIFPKSKLYEKDYSRPLVNALGNYCLLTAECNRKIGKNLPEEYFPKVLEKNPDALRSQWIPEDENLWKIENYPDFLKARKVLLAGAANRFLSELLHGDAQWLEQEAQMPEPRTLSVPYGVPDGDEEAELDAVNQWMQERGLPAGELSHEYADPVTGAQLAVFDLAWPQGVQEELSQPVVVLLNEPAEVFAIANKAGYRCFTAVGEFKNYVSREILDEPEPSA